MTSNFLQRLRDRDKNGGQPLPVSNRVEDEMNRLMTEVGDLAGPSSTLPSSKTSHISSIRHGSGAGSKNSSRRRSTLTDKKKKAFLADARRVRQELRTNSSFGESDLLRTKYVETLEVMSEMNRENDKLKSENLKLRTKINTLEMQDNLMERMVGSECVKADSARAHAYMHVDESIRINA